LVIKYKFLSLIDEWYKKKNEFSFINIFMKIHKANKK